MEPDPVTHDRQDSVRMLPTERPPPRMAFKEETPVTTRWLRIIFGRVLPGLMLLPFLAIPSAGATDARTGPLYLSAEAVQAAQTILVEEGYLRAGAYARAQLDEPTRQALRAFQRDHFIRTNGLLDPETMGMLTSHQPAALAERIRTSESTRGA